MATNDVRPLRLFYSYSSEDKAWRDQIDSHLELLKREGLITSWHDREIEAGVPWEGEIREHLEAADLILLLISPAFLRSDYCYERELTRALERHAAGTVIVIPVLVKPVELDETPFKGLQVLPTDRLPVVNWDNADEACVNIAKGLRKRIARRAREMAREVTPADDRDDIKELKQVVSRMRRRLGVQARMLWLIAAVALPGMVAAAYLARQAPPGVSPIRPIPAPDLGPLLARVAALEALPPPPRAPDLGPLGARVAALEGRQARLDWVICDYTLYQYYSNANIKRVAVVTDNVRAGMRVDPNNMQHTRIRIYTDPKMSENYVVFRLPSPSLLPEKPSYRCKEYFEFSLREYYDHLHRDIFLVLDEKPKGLEVILEEK